MSEDGKVTKKIFSSVYDRKIILIDLHFVFTQFLSGHGKFNVYLHKIGYRYKSSCFCGNLCSKFYSFDLFICC